MRTITAVTLLMVLTLTLPASAQKTESEVAAQLRSARVKMWIGVGLMAAGALAIPMTATKGNQRDQNPVIAMTLISGGAGFLLWGAQQQRRAVRPETTMGVVLGRSQTGLQLHHSW